MPLRIRLKGVESWELKGENAHLARLTAQKLTESFRGKTGPIIENKARLDNHGRTIADILIGEELLSNLIVSSGLAWYGVGSPQPYSDKSPQLMNGS